MSADPQEARGLARGIVGSARVTAFGTSIVAPAASVITALVIVLSYAGFASPLVVLITFVASLCCALSIAEFARRLPSAGWAYTYFDPPRLVRASPLEQPQLAGLGDRLAAGGGPQLAVQRCLLRFDGVQ